MLAAGFLAAPTAVAAAADRAVYRNGNIEVVLVKKPLPSGLARASEGRLGEREPEARALGVARARVGRARAHEGQRAVRVSRRLQARLQ